MNSCSTLAVYSNNYVTLSKHARKIGLQTPDPWARPKNLDSWEGT